MFCFAHIPKNFFARFARDPLRGGARPSAEWARGRGEIKYYSASRARLEIIFRRSPKKSFALHGRSKSEISTGFFLTARRRELSPSAAGQSPGASSSARRGRPKGRPHLNFINHNSYRKHDNLYPLHHTINDSGILLNGFYFK